MPEHNRGEDATRDWYQVRREDKILGRSFRHTRQHFRSVPVLENAIGLQVLIHFTEMRFLPGMPSGARDPRLAIRDDQRVRANHARSIERRERHDHRRRITARVGDKPRLAHFVRKELGEPVNRFLQQRGRRMREAVPSGVERRVLHTKGAAQVDDPKACSQ